MIRVEELMLGDVVTVNRSECVADGGQYMTWKQDGKIILIEKDYIRVQYEVDEGDDWDDWEEVDMKDIEPIPITPEILEKNGFWHETNVGYVLEDYEYEIIYDSWEHKLRILKNREQILKIDFFNEMCVHELQHALKLCGISKNIEL